MALLFFPEGVLDIVKGHDEGGALWLYVYIYLRIVLVVSLSPRLVWGWLVLTVAGSACAARARTTTPKEADTRFISRLRGEAAGEACRSEPIVSLCACVRTCQQQCHVAALGT